MLLAASLTVTLSGCQTFSLTEADLEKMRRGEPVDRDVAGAVDFLGILGAWHGAAGAAARSSR
jgi:hypothetical protein